MIIRKLFKKKFWFKVGDVALVILITAGITAPLVLLKDLIFLPELFVSRENFLWYPTTVMLARAGLAVGLTAAGVIVWRRTYKARKKTTFWQKLELIIIAVITILFGFLSYTAVAQLLTRQDLKEITHICEISVRRYGKRTVRNHYRIRTPEEESIAMTYKAYEHLKTTFGDYQGICKPVNEQLYYLKPLNILVWP